MANERVIIKLSDREIGDLLQYLEVYKELLMQKMEEFVQLLLEIGQQVAESNSSPAGDAVSQPSFRFEVTVNADSVEGKLIGEGSDITFVEFGSGYLYNGNLHSSPHPKGVELGMTIGDFPGYFFNTFGYSQGALYNGWYHDGEKHYGVQAGMPLYKATLEIQQRAAEAARQVFG